MSGDLRRARADLRVFSETIGQPLTESQAASLSLEQRIAVKSQLIRAGLLG